jgi:hypothetical protein
MKEKVQFPVFGFELGLELALDPEVRLLFGEEFSLGCGHYQYRHIVVLSFSVTTSLVDTFVNFSLKLAIT